MKQLHSNLSEELIRVCARMIDPQCGIVRRLVEVPLQPGEPDIFIVAAHCAKPKYFLRNQPFGAAGGDYIVPANGVAFDREEATWRALGETCERYAGGLYRDEDLTTASRSELGDQALPLENLIAFADAQYARPGFPFARVDPNVKLRWAKGWNLTRRAPCLIPASLVYLGYEATSAHENLFPSISTGMAAGRTLEQALLNGLSEVIERDAFVCTWLLERPPEQVSASSLQAALRTREHELFNMENIQGFALRVETDIGLPTAITLLKPRDGKAAVFGASANLSLRQAIARSALEAFHTLNWSIFLQRAPRIVPREQIRDFEDHVRYYLHPPNVASLSWLLSGPATEVTLSAMEKPDHQAGLEFALGLLSKAGYEAYYVETTTADVESIGFRTVRVIVPGLQPLHVGHDMAHEDDRRLRKVAAHWNVDPGPLNTEPHPFP